jgi:hypothetical protein
MTRTPMGTNEVVQVATPTETATESHPVITALSAVKATVPAEVVGVTVAVNVTEADDCALDALSDKTVADVVDVAAGVIVTAPLPVCPAPRNRVDRAVEIPQDDPPAPPPPGMFMPSPSAPPPPPK